MTATDLWQIPGLVILSAAKDLKALQKQDLKILRCAQDDKIVQNDTAMDGNYLVIIREGYRV